VAALRGENLEVPAGKIGQGPIEELVRVQGKFAQPEAFEDLIVKSIRGVPVYLRELASIQDGHEEQRTLALLDGKRALALEIRKQSGATPSTWLKQSRRAAANESGAAGETKLSVVKDLSVFIREAVEDVQTTLVLGAIFTVLVVFAFLNSWRSTVDH